MIDRPEAKKRVESSFRVHPAVVLEGPRQCGKSTLARMIGGSDAVYFDLERAVDLQKLATPEQTLGPLRGLVVIDEVQRLPQLFPPLRVLLDRPDVPAKFLLAGSASPDLVKGLSESLAGRMGMVDLAGFDLRETGGNEFRHLWLRGGFPRSFLAPDDAASAEWREACASRKPRLVGVHESRDRNRG